MDGIDVLLTEVGAAEGEDRPDWELDSCGERSELMSIIESDMDLKMGKKNQLLLRPWGKWNPGTDKKRSYQIKEQL